MAALTLAAACSRDPELPESDGAAEAPAAAPAPAERRLPLPDCSEVETQDAGADGWIHPDCRLELGDGSMLAVEVRYADGADGSTIATVQIVSPSDATLQTIEETMGNTFETPKLDDVDRDGRQDVWIPLETGNANMTWAVWRQTAEQEFVRLGELFGTDFQYTEEGLVVAPSRSSAAEWVVAFIRPGPDAFTYQASVVVRGDVEDDGTVIGWTCAVDSGAGLAEGLAPEAAEAKFCAEPAASGIFN